MVYNVYMTISDDNQSNLEDTDELAAETRQLLDAATQGDWKHLPPSEGGTIHRVVRLATDDDLSFPGIDMDEVRQVRLAYPDPERHETVSRAKYGASLAANALAAADRGVTDGEATTSRRPVQFDAYASNPWPDGEATDG